MSNRAETLVWERSRAGKSDLLMLIKIADLSSDEGRDCWAEVPYFARCLRASKRAAQNILNRLERHREIDIEYNDDHREIVLRGGRRWRPKWFIHTRCVYDYAAYLADADKPAESARLRTGRPPRKGAEAARLAREKTRSFRPRKAQVSPAKRADCGSAYKEGSLSDPRTEQEQAPPTAGAARRVPRPPPPQDPNDNVNVITKLAHEVLKPAGRTPHTAYGDVVWTLELRCQQERIVFNNEVVRKAIESALYQRRRAGLASVFDGSAGEAAFRLRPEAP